MPEIYRQCGSAQEHREINDQINPIKWVFN